MSDRTDVNLDMALSDAVRHRASMEDIALLRPPNVRTPEDAILALKRGNARFFGGQATRPELGANERRAQIMMQTPFAVVVGCSDSRVPIELVFDQGFGDLFIVRVAGNVADGATLGSVEYAVKHLHVHLVLVMGHEGCGAVKAAMLGEEHSRAEPENVRGLLERIRPAVANLPRIRDEKARMREAVLHNVRLQTAVLRENETVRQAVEEGRVRVIGGFYEISSGAVDFFTRDEELALETPG